MKLLVIRFSSFGDIVQASGVPSAFLKAYPGSSVDWLTREDFAPLLRQQPTIANVIPFSRGLGLSGLLGISLRLSRAGYTHVYDAHSNLRSTLVMTILRFMDLFRFSGTHFAVRPKNRVRRFLFFKFRLAVLPRPFRAADSYHRPLVPWGLPATVPPGPRFQVQGDRTAFEDVNELRKRVQFVIAIAPSAAWEMKRWPVQHWKSLIALLPDCGFLVLGGKEDVFLEEILAIEPMRCVNLAGRLSLVESAKVIRDADLVISNDTGSLQVADQMERPTIALIGPTAFGYPSHLTSVAIERPLWCQPCSKDGRGGCKNSLYKRCLVELTPDVVAKQARAMLSNVQPSSLNVPLILQIGSRDDRDRGLQ